MDWGAVVFLLCLLAASPVCYQIGLFVFRLFRVMNRKLAEWEANDLGR